MHETSIATTIWEQVRNVEKSNPGYETKRVKIEVGSFSGVETNMLADALETIIQNDHRSDVELILNEVNLVVKCEGCRVEFPVLDFHFECSVCGCKQLKMIDGDAIRLMHLDLQSKETCQ